MKLDQLEVPVMEKPEKQFYLVYARKSSESEDRQMSSISDQLNVIKEISNSKNLKILKVFQESRSAKSPGRTEFNNMISEIQNRNDIKGIICWKLNRLSRNPVDEGTLRWLLQSGQTEEIVTPDRTYTQVDSDFVMAIEGSQSQRFITDLKKDTLRGINSKLDKGICPTLAPPGYKNDLTKRQGERDIIPDEIQFPLVKKVFNIYLSGKVSVLELHRQAVKLGVRSNRGKPISLTQLYKVLTNPFYTGRRFIYAGKLYTNGTHKKMLLDEEFDLVQDIIERKGKPKLQINHDLLTGLLTCAVCNYGITAEIKTKHYKNGTSQTFTYYHCTKKRLGSKCSQPYIREEELYRQVDSFLKKLELRQDFIDWSIRWLKVTQKNKNELRNAKQKQLREEHDNTQKKLDRLYDLMIEGLIEKDIAEIKKEELKLQKENLRDQLENVDQISDEVNELSINTFEFLSGLRERFKNGTTSEKKTILKGIGSNLTIKDKKLQISLRKPFEYIERAVAEIDPRFEAKLPIIEADNAFLGSNNLLVGGLPYNVRTYYNSLNSSELLVYKLIFQYGKKNFYNL